MTVLGLAIVVLALFTVGIVLLVQALGKLGEPKTASPGQQTGQTNGAEAGAAPGGDQGAQQGSGEAQQGAPGPGPGEGSGKCPPESIQVTAATDKGNYKQNSTIKLELGVTNGHNASCAIDVGPKLQTYTVKQGDKVVWSSAFCVSGEQEEATQVFVSGARKNAVLPWDMIPTDDKCNRTADTLEPGQYQLVTKLGERESQPAPFEVDAPPTPTPSQEGET